MDGILRHDSGHRVDDKVVLFSVHRLSKRGEN